MGTDRNLKTAPRRSPKSAYSFSHTYLSTLYFEEQSMICYTQRLPHSIASLSQRPTH